MKTITSCKLATRNNHKSVMPTQVITVDKKTKLPKTVSVLNEAGEEQILITFSKVDLGIQHKEEEFAIDKFTEENSNTTGSIEKRRIPSTLSCSTMGRYNIS
ncbi:hypothetical protein [Ureibacillus acetophenoni]